MKAPFYSSHVTYPLACYEQRQGISIFEAHVDEQTGRSEHFRVDLDNGVCNGLLLVRINRADMLDFVERHVGVRDYV